MNFSDIVQGEDGFLVELRCNNTFQVQLFGKIKAYEDGYTAQKPEGRLYVDGFDSEAAARYHLEGLTDCKIMN